MKRHILWAAAILASTTMIGISARAQLPGQHINPNVTILLDTGRGMNWIKMTDADDYESDRRTNISESQCAQMNAQTGFSVGTTSWQMVLEAMLGSVPDLYQHCFYEEAGIRPLIKADTINGLGDAIMSDPQLLMENASVLTSEYWQFSREPHFRLINCRDPRSTAVGGRGDWNDEYQQCIGSLPGTVPGHFITTSTGREYWCQDEIDGETNYYVIDDGEVMREICLNFHPLAMDRSTDGVLELYRSLARFNLMTFDNLPAPTYTYWDAASSTAKFNSWGVEDRHRAGWDYGRDVPWYIIAYEQRDPNSSAYDDPIPATSARRFWNAGVRGPDPEAVGRMVPLSDDFESSNQDVRDVLSTTEPNHCSFDAAMFDDAGEYLYNAPEARPGYNGGADLFFQCRPKVAVFITDGIQTDALEFPQEYCSKNAQTGEPPPPWTALDTTKGYYCPFNATETEVGQMFHVVDRLASSVGTTDVQPLYLVVVGVNMKEKDDSTPNRCDVPASGAVWTTDAAGNGFCKPPAEDCIILRELSQSECTDNAEDSAEVWVTPRQYLNKLALAGWPTDTNVLPYVSINASGTFRQPPWRTPSAEDASVMQSEWCEQDESNCGGEADDGEENGAIFVDSAAELTEVLSMVLQSISPETVSTRTEIVTATNPDASVETPTAAAQFVFNSGYRSETAGPWKGYLYRQGQQCTFEEGTDSSNGGAVGSPDAFHDMLKDQTERRLYVRKPDITDGELAYSSDQRFKKGLVDLLVEFDNSTAPLYDNDLGIEETGSETEHLYVDAVAEYLYGNDDATPRGEHPLGDIYNSTPTVLTAPNERVPYASYQEFRNNNSGWVKGPAGDIETPNQLMSARQPLLYVGTNDGILHSFNVMSGLTGHTDLDAEGWGFIPTPLLPGIGKQFPVRVLREYKWDDKGTSDTTDDEWVSKYELDPTTESGYQHMFGVDASPVAADVLLYKNNNDTSVNELDYWRSIVVGGLGKGGYGYYALDVTQGPEHHPVYRWELSPDEYGVNAPKYAASGEDPMSDYSLMRARFAKMGMALSRPELAYVYIEGIPPKENTSSSMKHQVAVAILPGGYRTSENGGMEIATGVYIVRLADGKLIRFLDPTVDGDVDADNIASGIFDSPLFTGTQTEVRQSARVAQLIGQPVVPNSIRTGKVADQAFIGDDRGRIWQIDMSSMDPIEWKLRLFFDTLLAEHFPYRDCLSDEDDNAAGDAGFSECCTSKQTDVSLACTTTEIEAIFQTAGRAKEDLGTDKCTGKSCANKAYPFPRIPMLAPPTIVQDEERNNVLLFGTGQVDGLETLDHHRVFSITQKPEIQMSFNDGGTSDNATDDVTSSILTMGSPEVNWWLGEGVPDKPLTMAPGTELATIENEMFPSASGENTAAADGRADIGGYDFFGLGEKLLGRIFVFNKVAYFTTFTPLENASQNACDDGGSKIWGVNFNALTTTDGTGSDVYPQLQLPDETELQPFKVYDGTVLTGLRLVRRPSCGGREGFTLMVQRANPAAPATEPSSSAGVPPQIDTIALDLPAPAQGFTRVGIDSWSIVMGGS